MAEIQLWKDFHTQQCRKSKIDAQVFGNKYEQIIKDLKAC